MIVNVYQSITIHTLRINGISNSSILQVGTAGVIKSLSNNYNTGGYTGPAPQATTGSEPALASPSGPGGSAPPPGPLVPLPAV